MAEPAELVIGDPVAVGDAPASLAAGAGSIWVSGNYDQTLIQVDPVAREAVATVAGVGSDPGGVAILGGDVWVASDDWLRVDPAARAVVGSVSGMVGSQALEAGFASLWGVIDTEGSGDHEVATYVARIDPDAAEVAASYEIEGACPVGCSEGRAWVVDLAVGADAVWVAVSCDGCQSLTVYRIDPAADEMVQVANWSDAQSGWFGGSLALVGDTPWLAVTSVSSSGVLEGHLMRVDPGSGEIEDLLTVGRMPGLLGAGGLLWTTDCLDATLTVVDPEKVVVVGEPLVIGTPSVGEWDPYAEDYSCPGEAVLHDDTLWVCLWNDDALVPVDITY